MKAVRPLLLLALIFCLASPAAWAASASQGGFFSECGIQIFANEDLDVDTEPLYQTGVAVQFSGSLLQGESYRLDLRLEVSAGRFWGYDYGGELAFVPGLRAYLLSGQLTPYLEVGIGPSYNDLDIYELGMKLNFLSYGGAGFRIRINESDSLEIGYRVRHISNAGLNERNHGVTSQQAQLALVFQF